MHYFRIIKSYQFENHINNSLMKKVLIVLPVILVCLTSINVYTQVQSGWHWVNPKPQGNHLTSVAYLSNNIIVAAGWNGAIIRSSNAGVDWSYYRYNTTRDFRKLKFVNQNTGFVVGDSSLFLKTTDSGISWTRIQYFSSEDFWDLHFTDANTCYISSSERILKTTNCGDSFTILKNFRGFCIQFLDVNTGFCGGVGVIKTTNAGVNWTNVASFTAFGGYFFDSNNGLFTGTDSVFKTTNGGISWSSNPDFAYFPITTLKFVNTNTGFASSFLGDNLYKTINGGSNWSQAVMQNPELSLSGVDFVNGENLVAVGRYGLIEKTTNSGNTWQNFSTILYASLKSVCFPNSNTGFAAGSRFTVNKSIFKTTDQGNNWFELVNAPNTDFRTIYFLDVNTGFAGVYDSIINKTTNSGVSWSSQSLPEVSLVNDIKFVNSTTGFFCSNAARVYKTTNTGVNWTRVNYDANMGQFFKMFFVSPLVGYATGECLFKTTNGGDNWTFLTPPLSSNIINWSLHFFNENTGIIGGYSGEISRTSDGGLTWETYETNLQYSLMSIKFVNSNTGYIVGATSVFTTDLGILLKTTNGGVSWQRKNLVSNEELYDICFINETTGFIAGGDGLILKTTTGGEPIGIIQTSTVIPAKYYLSQNFPNPFNPVTNIKFDIPKSMLVKISVYDILGKEISILANEEMNAGSYSVDWDASNYPSGVYFYKITARDYSESKKMVLVK